MVELCDECMHLKFEKENSRCRCTEGKVIGIIHIGLVENCIYYDETTKKRCKGRVVETEWGKTCMCIEHTNKKKTTKTKSTNESQTNKKKTSSETNEKKSSKSEPEKEKKTENVKRQKRKPKKIVKNIKE